MVSVSDADSLISVVIATRDRDQSVTHTVDSILQNEQTDSLTFEIWVIDQSRSDRTQQAMQKYSDKDRVRYVRSHTTGMAKARNLGISKANGTIIAITDDDCIVSEQWLTSIQQTFLEHPDITILFGNVLPGEHNATTGFIPSYCRQQAKVFSCALDKNDVDGLGACMALRKETWKAFGGFDEMLGAGSILKSSSEGDLVLHALHQGQAVYETPEVFVVHNGFRTWEEGAQLVSRYWYGTGAMYAKHLKLYPIQTFLLLSLLAWRWAFGQSRVATSLGEHPQKLARLRAFVSGLVSGLRMGIDRETGHFADGL